MKKDDIHEILFVGESTRIPKIQQLLKDFIGKEPSRGINSGLKFFCWLSGFFEVEERWVKTQKLSSYYQ